VWRRLGRRDIIGGDVFLRRGSISTYYYLTYNFYIPKITGIK